jgi:hypothetical protein
VSATADKEVAKLLDAINAFGKKHGAKYCVALHKQTSLLQTWLARLEAKRTGHGDFLLAAVTCALRETGALLALGLVRPALSSMRLQIDLLFSWLYFKDHLIELQSVEVSGDGYKLKRDILNYLEIYPRFKQRLTLLTQSRRRSIEDPYRLLSAHIHGQTQLVIPKVVTFSDMVFSENICDELVKLQGECSEYVSDVLLAAFADDWMSLPNVITQELSRLNENQRKAFFNLTQ